MKKEDIDAVPALIQRLYGVVRELTELFPDRCFTPDGHLVGSIGEVFAAYRYGLRLLPASTQVHDAIALNGINVQIKATQAKSVALRAEPQHLIVLFLAQNGEVEEVFNGPGDVVWAACGAMQKNGQRPISVSKLKKLMSCVDSTQQLKRLCE